MSVKENLEGIRTRITEACQRVGRDEKNIKIIAVTKYVSSDTAKEAFEAGICNLGENRDDGLLAKWEVLGDRAVWHFIGSLQTKKVKNVIDKVNYIHSLDRLSLAKEIQKRSTNKVKCFIQVNVTGEESKHGINPSELSRFVEELGEYPMVEVVGLMTMAPFTDDKDVIRKCFRDLRILSKNVQAMKLPFAPCAELSMGMSNDFEIAIEEGATFIRIGSSLVGNEQK